MAKKRSGTLYLTASHIAALQALAADLGYLAGAGAAAGQGSASALVRALAEEPVRVARQILSARAEQK